MPSTRPSGDTAPSVVPSPWLPPPTSSLPKGRAPGPSVVGPWWISMPTSSRPVGAPTAPSRSPTTAGPARRLADGPTVTTSSRPSPATTSPSARATSWPSSGYPPHAPRTVVPPATSAASGSRWRPRSVAQARDIRVASASDVHEVDRPSIEGGAVTHLHRGDLDVDRSTPGPLDQHSEVAAVGVQPEPSRIQRHDPHRLTGHRQYRSACPCSASVSRRSSMPQ